MKKVHDNVHKRYSDKTMLTIKTNLLKIEQAPVNKGTFIGTGGTLGRAAVGMGIPMGMGMGWVWGLKFNPHGSPDTGVKHRYHYLCIA